MRIGIIDLGTNSVRFDVHQIDPDGQAHLLYREKIMIRLGEGVFLRHRLAPDAIQRSVQAFLSFKQTSKAFQTQRMVAFATSALREAADADSLIRKIRTKTEIHIQVISGVEEARLIASGILSHFTSNQGYFGKNHYGLVDIGGGSTEISICKRKEILHSASFPLGAAQLQQVFLRTSPPSPPDKSKSEKNRIDPVLALRGHIKGALLEKAIAEDWPQVSHIIGSSGTVRAIQRILKKLTNEESINKRSLSKLIKSMKTMTQEELLLVPGMESKRVDIILSGALLLEECMDALGAKQVIVSDFSLRDGILNQEITKISRQRLPKVQFRLEDLHLKAKKLGYEEQHARQVEKLASSLFDHLKKIHRLAPSWKKYLSAAAVFHDVGRILSPISHETHSAYIVRNSDLLSMEKWETEFIAQLCAHHNTGGLAKIDLSFATHQVHANAFVRILALLRVADSLDREHAANVTIRKITLKRRFVILKVSGTLKSSADLEMMRLEQKKTLFEEVFERKLVTESPRSSLKIRI